MLTLYMRRRLINMFSLGISVLAMAFGLFWLGWILFTLLQHGIPGLSLAVFTQITPPPGSSGIVGWCISLRSLLAKTGH